MLDIDIGRIRGNRFLEIVWKFPCPQKILMVADSSLNFGVGGFGLSEFLSIIQGAGNMVSTAHRSGTAPVTIAGASVFADADEPNAPLSQHALRDVVKAMGRSGDFVPHGFRSTFQDWAEEKAGFRNIVAKKALAHENKDKVEAAYLRAEFWDERVRLMDAWAQYVGSVPGKVAAMHA